VFGLLVALATAGGLLIAFGTEQVDGVAEDVDRISGVFPDDADRPAQTTGRALTFLVVGVDPSDAASGGTRAEAALLVRLTGNREHLQVLTLPPGTWVEDAGRTLEDAFAAEGPQGVVRAVETLSGVRVDHYAELDYAGLVGVTDALGGITLDVPQAYRNRGYDFVPGPQRFDGARAVAYVRDADEAARREAPDRYQRVVQALFDRIRELGAFSDAGRLSALLEPLTAALRVDASLADEDLVATAWEFRDISELFFLSVPSGGPSDVDGRQVSRLDEVRAGALWQYLRDDTLTDHVGEFR
jgi:LCP family protein required for cell wall assembly